jgi:hypothetical protein
VTLTTEGALQRREFNRTLVAWLAPTGTVLARVDKVIE